MYKRVLVAGLLVLLSGSAESQSVLRCPPNQGPPPQAMPTAPTKIENPLVLWVGRFKQEGSAPVLQKLWPLQFEVIESADTIKVRPKGETGRGPLPPWPAYRSTLDPSKVVPILPREEVKNVIRRHIEGLHGDQIIAGRTIDYEVYEEVNLANKQMKGCTACGKFDWLTINANFPDPNVYWFQFLTAYDKSPGAFNFTAVNGPNWVQTIGIGIPANGKLAMPDYRTVLPQQIEVKAQAKTDDRDDRVIMLKYRASFTFSVSDIYFFDETRPAGKKVSRDLSRYYKNQDDCCFFGCVTGVHTSWLQPMYAYMNWSFSPGGHYFTQIDQNSSNAYDFR